MKIAYGQIAIEFDTPEKNYQKAEQTIRKLASHGPDLIVLPEFILGSPTLPQIENFTSSYKEEYLHKFQALAKELNVNLVPGSLAIRSNTSTGLPLRNVAYFIGRSGEVEGSYQKKNVWHSERPLFEKGHEPHTVFNTEFGKVGMLLCWDLMFPEAFKEFSKQDVHLVVIPSFWVDGDAGAASEWNKDCEKLFLQHGVITRAFETNAVVVYVNVGANIGQSQVCLPLIGQKEAKVVEDNGKGDVLAIVEIGDDWQKVLKDAESVYKIREDMGQDDWHY